MNRHVGTVIVAPLTTKGRSYPTRIPLRFQRKNAQVVLDQIRTVGKTRLVRTEIERGAQIVARVQPWQTAAS